MSFAKIIYFQFLIQSIKRFRPLSGHSQYFSIILSYLNLSYLIILSYLRIKNLNILLINNHVNCVVKYNPMHPLCRLSNDGMSMVTMSNALSYHESRIPSLHILVSMFLMSLNQT